MKLGKIMKSYLKLGKSNCDGNSKQKEFFEKVDFEKKSADDKKYSKFTQ